MFMCLIMNVTLFCCESASDKHHASCEWAIVSTWA